MNKTSIHLNPSLPLPKLIALDLDYTLWPTWVDTHILPPLKATPNKTDEMVDRSGRKLSFYPDVPQILSSICSAGIKLAACSRTHRPDIAREALSGLQITLQPISTSSSQEHYKIKSIELFDNLQIYPGSKLKHFKVLQSELGINYEDMLFFDDEPRNAEVENLGVCFKLVDGSVGLDRVSFMAGIEKWRERRFGKT